jgi:type I restriction enzyme R subunit
MKAVFQYRPDIKDNTTLNQNFREKFEALNRVKLTDNEFKRILEQIIKLNLYSHETLSSWIY